LICLLDVDFEMRVNDKGSAPIWQMML
jgi:hypothetical protein